MKSAFYWIIVAFLGQYPVSSATDTEVPIVENLEGVLGDKYMKMQSGMCYSYDQSIGTYMQTKEMQLTNAKFTTVVDLTGVTYSSIA